LGNPLPFGTLTTGSSEDKKLGAGIVFMASRGSGGNSGHKGDSTWDKHSKKRPGNSSGNAKGHKENK
jgi:hypothetical protein